jgi:hypothetical protein
MTKIFIPADLAGQTNAQLVEVYNSLADTPIKGWKGKKDVLIAKIQALLPKKPAKPGKPSSRPSNKDGKTIREVALELLCKVDYYEDRRKSPDPLNRVEADHSDAGSVGLPYDRILELIREEFDGAKTSAACLRWYVVRVREGHEGYKGYDLPRRRPRQGSKS